MVALGTSALRPDSIVNLWRLEARDELPEPHPKVQDFPGWWEGAPRTYVLPLDRRLWESTAELGNPRAMTLLGCALTGGGNLAGREWLERSAQLGDLDGLLYLGLSWQSTNPERASSVLLRAAEQGHPVAMTAYAKAVSGAEAGKAMSWYDKAAAMGEVMAIFDLGLMAYHDPDGASAEPLFRDGAKRGFPPAMFMLARMVGKEDQADARGHVWSTLSLAREAHERRTLPGSRIETDYLWRAMELGSGDAAYELGSHAWPPSQRRKLWGKAQELGVDLAAQPPLPSFSDRLKLRWLSGRGQPR